MTVSSCYDGERGHGKPNWESRAPGVFVGVSTEPSATGPSGRLVPVGSERQMQSQCFVERGQLRSGQLPDPRSDPLDRD